VRARFAESVQDFLCFVTAWLSFWALGVMNLVDQMTSVWRQASHDLGFEFVAPFALPDGERTLHYLGLVPQFGTSKGMLVIVGLRADDHMRVAQQNGYGFSCFHEHFEPYERDSFIDILNDWGWSRPNAETPSWYTGAPWTLS
jgi:hypothetical protein